MATIVPITNTTAVILRPKLDTNFNALNVELVAATAAIAGKADTSAVTAAIVAERSASATLSGKSINGSSNTLTNIPAGSILGVIPMGNIATGTPTGSKFVRDDGTLQTPAGATPTTTEGDLIVRGAGSDQRLPLGTNGQVLAVDTTVSGKVKWTAAGGGSGDVVGPASAVSGNIPTFSGTTGKLLADSGVVSLQSVATSAGAADAGKLAVLNGSGQFDSSFGGGGIADPGSNGILARTAVNTVAARTITAAGPLAITNGNGVSGAPALTTSMATNRLIGRGTAATGVMEEIILGTNLSLSGTTLNATGGGTGDLLSTLSAAEIAVTGAVTATISRMHVCTGTSADYTVTLPAASGNTGKLIGFRMGSLTGLTKLVTIDGNASETINGNLTRVMWSSESAILICDGSNWFKLAGISIPMIAVMTKAANQTGVVTATATKFLLDTIIKDNTGRMCDAVTNKRINFIRAGTYKVTVNSRFFLSADAPRIISFVFKNGSSANFLHQAEGVGVNGGNPGYAIPSEGIYAAGDFIEQNGYHTAVSNQVMVGNGTTENSFLSAIETLEW